MQSLMALFIYCFTYFTGGLATHKNYSIFNCTSASLISTYNIILINIKNMLIPSFSSPSVDLCDLSLDGIIMFSIFPSCMEKIQ